MTNRSGPSKQAQRVLDAGAHPARDRSAGNLPRLRSQTRDFIAPAVQRSLEAHAVVTRPVRIAGVPCLNVEPAACSVDWPVLYGFGGGFVMGSPFEDLTIAAPIAAQTGARVIIPDYRLAPEHPWPAAIEDGFAVYQELAQDRFAIVGESAGGNFVLCLMQEARQRGLRLPSAAALLSPWCDLTNSGDSLIFNDGRDPTLATAEVNAAAAHYAGKHDRSNASISPLFGPFDETFPPCIITTGTRDLLRSPSELLAKEMTAAGVAVDLRVWDEMWHVFEWDSDLPEAAASLAEISTFLTDHMK